MPKQLFHIVPVAPGGSDGVSQVAHIIAQQLTEFDHTFFCVQGNKEKAPFKTLSLRDSSISAVPDGVIILHYIGYGYSSIGAPLWLPKLLKKTGLPLITFFHELDVSGSRLSKAYWLSFAQRLVIRQLLDVSAACLTSTSAYAHRLNELNSWAHTMMDVMPVPSAINELPSLIPYSLREPFGVVFGTPGRRRAVYENLKATGISEILDIGTSINTLPSAIDGIPVRALGELPDVRISEILSKARVGFLHYPANLLAKSSIFAAYASHGVITTLIPEYGEDVQDGIQIGRELVLQGSVLPDDLQHNAYVWYQKHSQSVWAEKIRSILSEPVCRKPRVLFLSANKPHNTLPLRLLAKSISLCCAYCSTHDTATYGEEWLNKRYLTSSTEINEVYLKNWSPIPTLGRWFGLINPGIFRLVRQSDICVVYGHNYASLFLATITAKLLRKGPIVTTDAVTCGSGIRPLLKKIFFPVWYRYLAAHVLVPSRTSREFLQSLGISANRITQTPYSCDEVWLTRITTSAHSIRESLGIADDDFVAVSVGKLIARKNILLLVQAWQALPTNAHLLIIGDGPERLDIESQATPNVHLLGFKKYEDLPSYYAAADVTVHPACHEPWGLPVTESMVLSRPVIASDSVGAAAELIIEGKTGWTFKNGDLESLTNILLQCLKNWAKLKSMGAAAELHVKGWSSEQNALATRQALNQIKTVA